MTESEFLESSYRAFTIRIAAYKNNQEAQARADWERTRWFCSLLLQPHSKRILRPRDITIFPWELPDDIPQSVPQHFQKIAAAMDLAAQKEGLCPIQ
jgi:hypothetical protein